MIYQRLADDILEYTCERYKALGVDVTPEMIKGKSRGKGIMKVRRTAAHLLHGTELLGLTDIGRVMCRDHGTINNMLHGAGW